MGLQGLHLNRWSLSFDRENDVPSAVPVWVRLPHLSLHCWNDEMLQAIGNSLGNYIDKAEPKGSLFSYVRICVEVYLEKGLPEAVNLLMDGWEHMQKLDYKQLPFKCKKFHEYGLFVKNYPKVVQETLGKNQEEGQQQPKRGRKNPPETGETQQKSSKENAIEVGKIPINNQYEALVMEDGEIPPLEMVTVEVQEEEAQEITSVPPLSPRDERSEKAMEGSTTLGGTQAQMVRNNRVMPQGYSPERSPSQGTQET